MIESLVADTSLIINLFNGHPAALDVLDNKTIWTSGIVEIETLASSKLSLKERALVKDFFSKIYVVDLIKPIKELAIEVRIESNLKFLTLLFWQQPCISICHFILMIRILLK